MTPQHDLFEAQFDPRFVTNWLGSMVNSPTTAIIELIANAYDAFARNVWITWPTAQSLKFVIKDDGHGMTFDEFSHIWPKMSYDRIKAKGETVKENDYINSPERRVFGKNGKGRFSPLCFSESYLITSSKNGKSFKCLVEPSESKNPFKFTVIEQDIPSDWNGTIIELKNTKPKSLVDLDIIKRDIGSRFISRPDFKIMVNNSLIWRSLS
jgi:hypothetical protein